MKKILLMILSFAFLLTGCSKDEDEKNSLKNHPLLGTWILSDYKAEVDTRNYTLKDDLEKFLMNAYLEDNTFLRGSTITFYDSGKAILESYEGEKRTMTFTATKTAFVMKDNGEEMLLDFEIRDDKLITYSNQLKACKQQAIRWEYTDTIIAGELVETYTKL